MKVLSNLLLYYINLKYELSSNFFNFRGGKGVEKVMKAWLFILINIVFYITNSKVINLSKG